MDALDGGAKGRSQGVGPTGRIDPEQSRSRRRIDDGFRSGEFLWAHCDSLARFWSMAG